jgi:hypothetical protein
MFLFSSDRIRFVVPLVGSESSQNLAGARAALTDDSRRFTFEIKSDSCIYRTTIEKLILKSGYYQIVLFARCRRPNLGEGRIGKQLGCVLINRGA